MAKKSTLKNTSKESSKDVSKKSLFQFNFFSFIDGLSDETRHSIIAIFFLAIGIFFSIAPFGKAGFVGENIYRMFSYLLGVGYFILPLLFFLLGISLFRTTKENIALTTSLGAFLFLFSSLGLMNIFSGENDGGLLGNIASYPLVKLFDTYVATLFLFAFLIISFLIIFNTHLKFSSLLFWRKNENDNDEEDADQDDTEEEDIVTEKEMIESASPPSTEVKKGAIMATVTKIKEVKDEMTESGMVLNKNFGGDYVPPQLSLLEGDRGKPGVGDIKAKANIIKRTLGQYGITVEMDEVSIGPSVTRYTLKPAEGVKLSRIVGLQSELSYALAAHPIRIEAPIPGLSLVGIEVPNSIKTIVGTKTLFSSDEYRESHKPLLIALGRGVSGKLYFADFAKMPHILIAGATGSGKSVTIHTIINSLLYRNAPENLRFIMIDPKRVELTLYNKIPHLLTPVITDAKKAILALKWLAKEMDRRYNILESNSVRDISSYHKNIYGAALKKKNTEQRTRNKDGENADASIPEKMPYIVIILDELADIMQTYPRELESAIVRIAQMSRAVGIHLILSTQRPSVNVITGLIKANVPARIALQVSSQIDSRTILDASGAEKLLGAGDMLYMSGEMAKPTRIQCPYISETEVKNIVKYLAELSSDRLPDEINLSQGSINGDDTIFSSSFDEEDSDDEDELYEEARAFVIEAKKASTSYLQRRLKVGYARAARLMDILEERGIIGPGDGAKPRQVFEAPPDNQGEQG
ncbi:MAG: DNA translocase FtsK 4TM domain-containing protein [Candidatus Yonathbacteria bacterium]|nr:DNA translocase FtsK 4TM domain-containing protein [Candidatus Yonathbacteria bacterium]